MSSTGGGLHHAMVNRGDGTFGMIDIPDDALRAMAQAIQDSNPDLYQQILANLPTQ